MELKPDWPKGYSRKGFAEYNLGQLGQKQKLADAEATYNEGLKLAPEDATLKEGLQNVLALKSQQSGSGGTEGGAAPTSELFSRATPSTRLARATMKPFQASDFGEIFRDLMALEQHDNHDEYFVSGVFALACVILIWIGLKKLLRLQKPSWRLQQPLLHMPGATQGNGVV